MMINSSRFYGPVQVRDLSEHWGQAELTIGIGEPQATAADTIGSYAIMSTVRHENVLYTELPLSQYPNCHALTPPRASTWLNYIKEVAPVWSQRKPSLTRIGALFQSVRGSIPSSAIRSMTCAPIYKQSESSGQTQPLKKATVDNLI